MDDSDRDDDSVLVEDAPDDGIPLELIERLRSTDGSFKYAFRLRDGLRVETAFFQVPERVRPNIVCVSTQVGCAVGCPFCAATQSGLMRNLSSGEIVGQVERALQDQAVDDILDAGFEVSFMGMGEPLANLPNLLEAIQTIGAMYPAITRVSVSTAGPSKKIDALLLALPAWPAVHLQISLHATRDEIRRLVVPHVRDSIGALIGAGRRFYEATKDKVCLNYVLLRGINDTENDAAWLADLNSDAFYVKLTQLNVVSSTPSLLVGASPDAIHKFAAKVQANGLFTKIFVGDGLDVNASCGQLAAVPRELPIRVNGIAR
jgi:23S rRNA (adenine2503-C2)-methyltransferase